MPCVVVYLRWYSRAIYAKTGKRRIIAKRRMPWSSPKKKMSTEENRFPRVLVRTIFTRGSEEMFSPDRIKSSAKPAPPKMAIAMLHAPVRPGGSMVVACTTMLRADAQSISVGARMRNFLRNTSGRYFFAFVAISTPRRQ